MLLRTALCRSTSAGARSLHTALLRRAPRAAPLLRAAPSRASGTFHHVKEADNLEETPFEFDEEAEKEIAFTLNKYPDTLQGRQSGIMPLLWIVQAQLDRAHATIKADNPRGAMAFPKSQGGGGWAGNPVKIGPQNGLTNSEGPMGRTSLIEPPLGPQCRDLGA
ncbi:hypothetical protein EMIHUDRAFT_242709 [Emiliania huxleyi CCMP1516]|uniref:Uncharacterized protein n=2 Tax=Emiliania huxleyi TaxID=2903 RepID=A0A0D3J888_EMIH1|nr:hypothetical protein EMIHUDRAFT_242709 [Emiliania huxleyi CCMP1516]EOD19723.1 hypothetical protein EMIHUDRAFT_242709 [Emiliania huxleyi CCMP1516]|eukprot:XP_005772152.1 hypothetical protein EMIHUDRAFT_242709 [Emiliania huxleyi CCMP1516]